MHGFYVLSVSHGFSETSIMVGAHLLPGVRFKAVRIAMLLLGKADVWNVLDNFLELIIAADIMIHFLYLASLSRAIFSFSSVSEPLGEGFLKLKPRSDGEAFPFLSIEDPPLMGVLVKVAVSDIERG